MARARRFSAVVVSFTLIVGVIAADGERKGLRRVIGDDYDKRVAPWMDSPTPTAALEVGLSIPFIVLLSVKENERNAEWLYSYTLKWKDERLQYTARHPNETVYIPANEVWKPRFFVYNAIEQREAYGHDDDNTDVSISPTGDVVLRRTQYASTVCEVDVSRFPFDTQFCVVAFSSPVQPIELMRLKQEINAHRSITSGNSEFELVNITSHIKQYSIDGLNYESVMFVTHLRRYPTYYVVMVVLPTYIIAVIAITGALVPMHEDEATDVAGLALGTLLALIFMLGIVANELPKTPGLAWLGYYIMEVVLLCSVALAIGFGRGLRWACPDQRPSSFWFLVTNTNTDLWRSPEKSGEPTRYVDAVSRDARHRTWARMQFRVSVILCTTFQVLNLLLLLGLALVAWLPAVEFPGVSF